MVDLFKSILFLFAPTTFRVANCEEDKKKEDKLDETLRKVHQVVEEAKADLKEKANEKAEEIYEELKEKYMTEELEEVFTFIKNIMGKNWGSLLLLKQIFETWFSAVSSRPRGIQKA